MQARETPVRPSGSRGTFFYLSYAHAAPTSESVRTDTDAAVRDFFKDLSRKVRRRSRSAPAMDIGFIDEQLPPGADWKVALAEALGVAQVFVALYSPRYFRQSWVVREQKSFAERVAASGQDPVERIVPVLWTPVPSWDETPEIRRAHELGRDIPAYAENGMRALCMLSWYRDEYDRLLDRLAHKIIELADRAPLRPSPAPHLDDVAPVPIEDPPTWAPEGPGTETPFVIAVTAPTATRLPPDRAPGSYGQQSSQWRPFADQQELPIAAHAASTVERLGFRARVVSYSDGSEPFAAAPALLLIDPWVAGGAEGVQGLRAALKDLPEWVVPLLIADRDDPQYGERGDGLADEVMTMLQAVRFARPESVARVKDFMDVMPSLVAEARRRYLRRGPVHPPSGESAERPSLRRTEPSTPATGGKQTDD